jgi:hypothetical protein
VVQQSDSCYVAIGKQRRLGLIALNTPLGVLLASFGRAAQPAVALSALQAACSEGLSCRQQQSQQGGGAKQQPAAAAAAASGVHS